MPFPRLLFLLGLLVSACGRAAEPVADAAPTEDGPAAMSERFFEALARGDEEGLGELFSARGLHGLRESAGFRCDADTFADWSVGEAVVEGARASVPVRAKVDGYERELEVGFRWRGKRWYLALLRLSFPEIGDIVVDYEELGRLAAEGDRTRPSGYEHDPEELAALDAAAEAREAASQRARYLSIAPTTRRKYENHWAFNLVSRGRVARKVLEEVVAGTGVALEPGTSVAVERALARRVRLEARGISRIEALERVAAAVGLVPVYPEDTPATSAPAIRLEEGERNRPVIFAGPFLVAVESLEERVPVGTGELRLGVHALGVAPAVLGFQDRLFEHVVLTAVRGPGGEDLRARRDVRFLTTPDVREGYWGERVTLELRGLVRSVRKIASVEGRLVVRLPERVETFLWPAERTSARPFGERTLELVQWGERIRFRFHADRVSLEGSELRFSPLGELGAPLRILSEDSFGLGGVLTAGVETTEPPRKLGIKVCRVAEVAHEFSLGPVPLPRHEEMPAALRELSFEGESPVHVRVVEVVEREGEGPVARLSFLNASNKDVRGVTVELVYLDAYGREIGRFPHEVFGEDGAVEPLGEGVLARGMSRERECAALFRPEWTAEVAVEVVAVEFFDAGGWSASARTE